MQVPMTFSWKQSWSSEYELMWSAWQSPSLHRYQSSFASVSLVLHFVGVLLLLLGGSFIYGIPVSLTRFLIFVLRAYRKRMWRQSCSTSWGLWRLSIKGTQTRTLKCRVRWLLVSQTNQVLYPMRASLDLPDAVRGLCRRDAIFFWPFGDLFEEVIFDFFMDVCYHACGFMKSWSL